jgi:hypothetical protein
MKQIVIYSLTFTVTAGTLLLVGGCPAPTRRKPVVVDQQDKSAKLALKFAPGDSTTYKVALETGKSVEWEGRTPRPKGFQGGHTSNEMEMTFSQQIESVENQGNAIAKITIEGLTYVTTIKDKSVLDFDSSRGADENHVLNKLIGQSYTIEITPSGEVSRIIDTSDAMAAASGDKTAVSLLSPEAIKQRHSIPALPAADENQFRPGEDWSSFESVSFDMMGAKSFERIYKLERIEDTAGHRMALVEMQAVPAAERDRESRKEQTAGLLSNMFDNKEYYTGELKFDLTEGKVTKYNENLVVQWFIVDPNPKKDQLPAALKMAATRSFSMEKVN